MPQVAVAKVNDAEKKTLPVFGEIAKRLEGVRQRAFDLFEKRGGEPGREMKIGSTRSTNSSVGRRRS